MSKQPIRTLSFELTVNATRRQERGLRAILASIEDRYDALIEEHSVPTEPSAQSS